jgi:hypothetical protein
VNGLIEGSSPLLSGVNAIVRPYTTPQSLSLLFLHVPSLFDTADRSAVTCPSHSLPTLLLLLLLTSLPASDHSPFADPLVCPETQAGLHLTPHNVSLDRSCMFVLRIKVFLCQSHSFVHFDSLRTLIFSSILSLSLSLSLSLCRSICCSTCTRTNQITTVDRHHKHLPHQHHHQHHRRHSPPLLLVTICFDDFRNSDEFPRNFKRTRFHSSISMRAFTSSTF